MAGEILCLEVSQALRESDIDVLHGAIHLGTSLPFPNRLRVTRGGPKGSYEDCKCVCHNADDWQMARTEGWIPWAWGGVSSSAFY